jgi:hypothetical protein
MRNTWLNALGENVGRFVLRVCDLIDWAIDNWWNVAVATIAAVLIVAGVRFHAELVAAAEAYFATPAGFSMLINLFYLGIALVVFRLLVFWANHSSVTGQKFDIHRAFDKVFEDANATSRLLGLCAIAFAVLVAAFVGG